MWGWCKVASAPILLKKRNIKKKVAKNLPM